MKAALLVHSFFLELLWSELGQFVMSFTEETLDQHETDVGFARTRLNEDDRAEILVGEGISGKVRLVLLVKSPLGEDFTHDLDLIGIGVLN